MSALAEQHERWSGVKERLWNASPPAPKQSRRINAVSPFVRAKRAREREWREQQRQAFERQMTRFRAGFTDPSLNAPAEEWPSYTPPVTYDSYAPPTATPRTKTMKEIIREVAAKHKLSVTEILSFRRTRHIVSARHEAIWRCKMETTNSLPAIGRAFGGFDHTTVLHAIRMHEKRMREAAGAN